MQLFQPFIFKVLNFSVFNINRISDKTTLKQIPLPPKDTFSRPECTIYLCITNEKVMQSLKNINCRKNRFGAASIFFNSKKEQKSPSSKDTFPSSKRTFYNRIMKENAEQNIKLSMEEKNILFPIYEALKFKFNNRFIRPP